MSRNLRYEMRVRKSLLIVDDEETMRELLRRVLEPEGYDVTTAADIDAALEAVERVRPAAVLCDVHMRGSQDGLWLADQIRTHAPTTAVLLVTGDASIPPRESLRRGIVAYLVKPFNRETLLDAVKAAIVWTRTERTSRPASDRRPGLDDWLDEVEP
jgi:DNA-binding NtrC family response regulator